MAGAASVFMLKRRHSVPPTPKRGQPYKIEFARPYPKPVLPRYSARITDALLIAESIKIGIQGIYTYIRDLVLV